MSAALKLAAAAALLTVLYTVVHAAAPAYAPVLALAGVGVVLVVLAENGGGQVLKWLPQLQQAEGTEAFSCLFKSAGILLITGYTRSLCRDAGLSSAGTCVEFGGRCLVLLAAWPVLQKVLETIEELCV